MATIADIRKEYMLQTLLETDVESSAFLQFTKWWNDALKSEIDEVNAMTLATASLTGVPSARVVLLKDYSEKGFVFFTNYNSQKGRELEENPLACLIFFWKELERQVRITGSVEKLEAADSDEYFYSRPRGSQLGAWASPQSQHINNRQVVEENLLKYGKQFGEGKIPRPPHWGGYLVKPSGLEFWQGRPNRLHDRICYSLKETGGWRIERLAP